MAMCCFRSYKNKMYGNLKKCKTYKNILEDIWENLAQDSNNKEGYVIPG